MNLILHTSGSTDQPKQIKHSWEYINVCALKSIQEIGLSKEDRVLDVFPANVIAHYTITAYPALKSGAELYTSVFNPYEYIEQFKRIQPTYISLIPRHLEVLEKTKGFKNLDMSCVRYMVTGSSKIEQYFIDFFLDRGVCLVANWYGMTEFPPPILIGYNSTKFNLNELDNKVSFKTINKNSPLAECIINNEPTGDIFNIDTMEFHSRKTNADRATWKTFI